MTDSERLSNAQIQWREDRPESVEFGDIYFSVEDGVAETDYVFIDGNQLGQRWSGLDDLQFTIIETGFGTGLNFLCARKLWLEQAPQDAQLHFISCEKYPLRLTDLRRAHHSLAALNGYASGCQQLQAQWPATVSGFHRLNLDQGRIRLTLLYGDAAEQLKALNARADAWFLDGFAPAKNPEMWSQTLFSQLARLSHSHTTLATFTSAGLVRRGLQEVGFAISKRPGFGRKREMVTGHFTTASTAGPYQAPWLARPAAAPADRSVAVIGAGLAGATTANALAMRGYSVKVFERAAAPACGGSGNLQGALYAKLPAKPTPQGQFHLAGMLYSIRLIRALGMDDGDIARLCGLLQLAPDAREAQRQQSVIDLNHYPEEILRRVSAEQASQLAGSSTQHPGLYLPNAGWVSPAKLVVRLLEHPKIQTQYNTELSELICTENGWQIGTERFSSLVVCTAWETELLRPWTNRRVKPIRGQVSHARADAGQSLDCVVCGEGYISPPRDGVFCFGSSFVPGDTDCELRASEEQHNLGILQRALPELAAAIGSQLIGGKVAHRAGTPDYMPMVGPVCDDARLRTDYAALAHNARQQFSQPAPFIPGLYVNLGHGSKGLISCPLAAEIIAACIHHEPFPVEQSLVDLLSPQRFTIREIIKS